MRIQYFCSFLTRFGIGGRHLEEGTAPMRQRNLAHRGFCVENGNDSNLTGAGIGPTMTDDNGTYDSGGALTNINAAGADDSNR